MKEIHIEILERLKKEFPSGTRVALVKMDDPYSTLKAGDKGSSLGIAFGEDICRKITE